MVGGNVEIMTATLAWNGETLPNAVGIKPVPTDNVFPLAPMNVRCPASAFAMATGGSSVVIMIPTLVWNGETLPNAVGIKLVPMVPVLTLAKTNAH